MLPVGANPPARVAVSETEPPSGDAWVTIVGAAGVTITDSLASLQAVRARICAPAPYSATQRYVPAAAVVTGGDWYTSWPATTGTETIAGVPVQVASSGP